jgi:hypothetical protein
MEAMDFKAGGTSWYWIDSPSFTTVPYQDHDRMTKM